MASRVQRNLSIHGFILTFLSHRQTHQSFHLLFLPNVGTFDSSQQFEDPFINDFTKSYFCYLIYYDRDLLLVLKPVIEQLTCIFFSGDTFLTDSQLLINLYLLVIVHIFLFTESWILFLILFFVDRGQST